MKKRDLMEEITIVPFVLCYRMYLLMYAALALEVKFAYNEEE